MGMDTEYLVVNPGFYDYDLSEYLPLLEHAYIKYFLSVSDKPSEKILHIVCRSHSEEAVLEELRKVFPFDNYGFPQLQWEDTQILIRRDHQEKYYAFLNIEKDEKV